MKSIIFVLVFLYAGVVDAKLINSPFGYSLDIPESWIPLTGNEIKDNPDLFDFDKVSGMSSELLAQVKPMILSGKAEFYFLPDTTLNFADNVNVTKLIGHVPTKDAEIEPLCKSLPQQLSTMFKHSISLYKCEIRKVNNLPGLYLEFDGATPGTRSLQYQVQKSKNVYLVITATVKNATYELIEAEFHSTINTIIIK